MTSDAPSLGEELDHSFAPDNCICLSIMDEVCDGFWYWNLEQPDRVWPSPRLVATLDFAPGDHPAGTKAWQDLIHPDDLPAAIAAFERHRDDPSQPYDVVVRYGNARGGTSWIRCRGVIMRDDSDRPVRMFGTHSDVTDLVEARAALERKAAALQLALDEIHRTRAQVEALAELVPLCAWCGCIQSRDGSWRPIEHFVAEHTGSSVSHGICPTCARTELDEAAPPEGAPG